MFERSLTACIVSGAIALLVTRATARADAGEKLSCVATHEGAQRARIEGRLVEARAGLQSCARPSCPRIIREDCGVLLGALEQSLPTVIFTAADELGGELRDVMIAVDGKVLNERIDDTPRPLNPGVHTVRFSARGYSPHEQQVTIHEGEKARVVPIRMHRASDSEQDGLAAARQPGPNRSERGGSAARWLGASYVLASTAVAAFVVTGAAALRGYNMQRRCEEHGCSDGYAARGKRLYRTVNASAVVGGVLMAAGVGAFVTGRVARTRQQGRLDAFVAREGAALCWTDRF